MGSLFVARSQCSRAQRERTAATGKTGEASNSDRISSFFSLTIKTNVLKTLKKKNSYRSLFLLRFVPLGAIQIRFALGFSYGLSSNVQFFARKKEKNYKRWVWIQMTI